ncbi:hypothetical protein BRC91_06975 [Halobacteriales archaeon QS_4_62_28]|nr:MAG: hypothetical protein BRC91_06975 [Halobacteriales archaeon QS_4_62_28]
MLLMGRIINIDNQGGNAESVLTETGKGGLLSSGYLRDDPAETYLRDETPQFVLTNQKRGVEIERESTSDHVTPGSGYRTITIVSDRRLLALVGDSSHENADGDQRISIPFTEIESVGSETSRGGGILTVSRSGDAAWQIHTGSSGLDTVETYVQAAVQAWNHVETTLDDVTRTLVAALDHRDDGEYDDALDAAQAAADQLEDATRTARALDEEWNAAAITDRVQEVEQRTRSTLATVRASRARTFTDDAQQRWHNGDLEGAHDAYDRANEQYDAILSLPPSAVEDREQIEAEAKRVRRVTEELETAPLQEVIDADRAASEAEEPEAIADTLEGIIESYRRVLELDRKAENRRFAGDPGEIRERLGEIVEEVTSTRRNAAKKAQQAGNWHMGTDQYELAVEEFETARTQFGQAIAVATDHYPDAVDHLESDRSAVEEQLERATAARDGETIGTEAETPDRREDGTATTDGGDDDSATDDPATDIEARLRQVDEERFGDIVASVLGESGWTVEGRGDRTVTVSRESPTAERMLVRPLHRPEGQPVGAAAIETCREQLAASDDIDAVMIATSAGITSEATREARDDAVRLLDDTCLAAIIESRDRETELTSRRVALD